MSQTRIFRHRKTGGHYILLQDLAVREQDLQPMVAYRHVDGGSTWVRPFKEFFDGRYEEIRFENRPDCNCADVVGTDTSFPVADHSVRLPEDVEHLKSLRRHGWNAAAERYEYLLNALEGMT